MTSQTDLRGRIEMLMDVAGVDSPHVASALAREVHRVLVDSARYQRNASVLAGMGLTAPAQRWSVLAERELNTAWANVTLFAMDRHRLKVASGDRTMVTYGRRLIRFSQKLRLDGYRADAARVLALVGQARREAVAR